MLNQVAVEALYSATYLENYLDSVENLPNDLQRHISRMRQLDVDFQGRKCSIPTITGCSDCHPYPYSLNAAILQDIEQYKDVLQKGPDAVDNNGDSTEERPGASGGPASLVGSTGHWRKRLLQKVQTALIDSLEIGDEKLQLVQSMQDAVEVKSRQLEADCKALGKWFDIVMGSIFAQFEKLGNPAYLCMSRMFVSNVLCYICLFCCDSRVQQGS